MTLGLRIQALRKKQGLSQEALGEALGVSRQAISKWEGDQAIPELDKLTAMAALFGVTLDYLVRGEEGGGGDAAQESAPRARRKIRLLTGLCALLAVLAAVFLGSTVYFYQRVLNILDPPTAPLCPVTEVEYAYEARYEDYTFDFGICLTSQELKGWDVTLELSSYTVGRDKEPVEREQTLRFRDGQARASFDDVPFGPHRLVSAVLVYEKGELQGQQSLVTLEPTGPGLPHQWEVQAGDPFGLTQVQESGDASLLPQE